MFGSTYVCDAGFSCYHYLIDIVDSQIDNYLLWLKCK